MKFRLLVASLGFSIAFSSAAQVVRLDPVSGDAWVDTRIGAYEDYWRHDRDAYLDSMHQNFGYERPWYEDILERGDVSPGELYYACTLARQMGRSCQSVLDERQQLGAEEEQGRGQGWGVIAMRHGIKPGSAEFHRMKTTMRKDGERLEHGRDLRDRAGQGHHHESTRMMKDTHGHHAPAKHKNKSGHNQNKKPHHKSPGRGHRGH